MTSVVPEILTLVGAPSSGLKILENIIDDVNSTVALFRLHPHCKRGPKNLEVAYTLKKVVERKC